MRRVLSKKKSFVHESMVEKLARLENSFSEMEKTVIAKLTYMQAYHVKKYKDSTTRHKELESQIKKLREITDEKFKETEIETRKAVYQVEVISHAYKYLAGQLDRVLQKGMDADSYEQARKTITETKEGLEKAHRDITKAMRPQ